MLPALEFLERTQVRVLVAEVDDQAQRDLVVFHVVEKRTAGGGLRQVAEGPADGMDDLAGHVLLGIDLPEFLETDCVVLGPRTLIQVELTDEPLAEVAATAFSEDRVLGVKLVAGREGALVLAAGADAHVAGRDASDRAVLVVEHLGGCEAGEDVDAHGLRLLGQPAAEVAEGQRIVAMVVGIAGNEIGRHLHVVGVVHQVVDVVFGHRVVERRAAFLPIGEELVQRRRLEDGPGEDVGADFRAFLHQAHRQLAAVMLGELHQAARGRQARGTAADDDDVELHGFSFHVPWLRSLGNATL